jgi:hypothetical protein
VTGPAVNQWLTGETKSVDPTSRVHASLTWLMTGKGDPARKAGDPLSSAEERLLQDYRKLPPKVRAEVGRLVRAIASA